MINEKLGYYSEMLEYVSAMLLKLGSLSVRQESNFYNSKSIENNNKLKIGMRDRRLFIGYIITFYNYVLKFFNELSSFLVWNINEVNASFVTIMSQFYTQIKKNKWCFKW